MSLKYYPFSFTNLPFLKFQLDMSHSNTKPRNSPPFSRHVDRNHRVYKPPLSSSAAAPPPSQEYRAHFVSQKDGGWEYHWCRDPPLPQGCSGAGSGSRSGISDNSRGPNDEMTTTEERAVQGPKEHESANSPFRFLRGGEDTDESNQRMLLRVAAVRVVGGRCETYKWVRRNRPVSNNERSGQAQAVRRAGPTTDNPRPSHASSQDQPDQACDQVAAMRPLPLFQSPASLPVRSRPLPLGSNEPTADPRPPDQACDRVEAVRSLPLFQFSASLPVRSRPLPHCHHARRPMVRTSGPEAWTGPNWSWTSGPWSVQRLDWSKPLVRDPDQ